MIKYFQELLNECVDLTENKKLQKEMSSTLEIMKDKLITLKGGIGMRGKHTSDAVKIRQLEETITLKDKEIKDIKRSLVNKLQEIRNLNESNCCGDQTQRKRKISEMCNMIIFELCIDEFYEKEKAKIIELPTTYQSNK